MLITKEGWYTQLQRAEGRVDDIQIVYNSRVC